MVADLDKDVLSTVPLLPGVRPGHSGGPCPCRMAGRSRRRRGRPPVGFGPVLLHHLSGRYHVFIDARPIRTLGPGDHFGELAARDWGGGYGYTRLATVRCAEPGQVLRLTSQDFQWLVDSEPAIQTEAKILAERLQER